MTRPTRSRRSVPGSERPGRTHGVVEGAALGVTHVREAVDEEDDVRVPLQVLLVDDEPVPARRRPPVDRAQAVAGNVLAEVGVLDAVALRSDLASREHLRLAGRKDALELLGHAGTP